MAGELESGTIWWDLSGPAASQPPSFPKVGQTVPRLKMSPTQQPTGWEPLMGRLPRFQPPPTFPPFSPDFIFNGITSN